jgi:transposase-like protein
MHKSIMARLEPEIKPEQEFQQSEQLEEEGRCRHCGSGNLKSGAGRKAREESIRCADCRRFLGYQPIAQLKRLRRGKKLTESLELLENQGIRGEETQLFILSAIGEGEA